MNRTLNVKLQKLVPVLPDTASAFSSSLVIEPDTQELLERRGTLYCVFNLNSSAGLDTLLVRKILTDVLHDSYYQSENTSPIQALEKSVVAVRDNVLQLMTDANAKSGGDFNILIAVLWGNVLYLVQYGNGGMFLVRDGGSKSVNSASEGNFTVASGVVKDNDVVIIGTEQFLQKYPAEMLFQQTEPISSHDLSIMGSAMVLKFSIDETFSDDEVVRFKGAPISQSGSVGRGGGSAEGAAQMQSSGGVKKLKLPKIGIPKLPFLGNKQKQKKDLGIKINRKQNSGLIYKLVIVFLAVGFLISVGYSLVRSKQEGIRAARESLMELVNSAKDIKSADEESLKKIEEAKKALNENDVLTEEEKAELSKTLEDKLLEATGVNRIPTEVFYDLKLMEATGADQIAILDNLVVVANSASGEVYTSSASTPKFEKLGTSFTGISSINYYGGDLAFSDSEGYKVYDLVAEEVSESYEISQFPTSSASYIGFIYGIVDNTVTKYTRNEDTLDSSVWATSDTISGGKGIAVDGNIYVISSDDKILKFYTGALEDFEVTGLANPLKDVVSIYKTVDQEFIYVAEKGLGRVIILNEDGEIQRQFIPEESSEWADIKDIAVDVAEETLFVLSGTKVYKISL